MTQLGPGRLWCQSQPRALNHEVLPPPEGKEGNGPPISEREKKVNKKNSGCAHAHACITGSGSKFPLSALNRDPDLRTEHAAPTQHPILLRIPPFSGPRLSKTQPRHTRHARDLKRKKNRSPSCRFF